MRPLLASIVLLGSASLVTAREVKPDKYRPTIDKGLAWLVQKQAKDGSWAEDGGRNSTSSTAFAGVALLADGNTLTEGKHSANLRRAVDWFLKQQPSHIRYVGVLGDMDKGPGRYLPEHGVALSFLAQVYGEAEGADHRAALRKLLDRAIEFSVAAQSSQGGWFYTSVIEGHDSSENVATMLQLQGLMDARNAGLKVPKQTVQKAFLSLKRSTTDRGGISYSAPGLDKPPPAGGGRPTINAMALAAFLPGCRINEEPVRGWLAFCAETPILFPERMKLTDVLTHYYFSKVVIHLKEDDWRTAFPGKKMPDHLNWAKYRPALFDQLQREQKMDGSWDAPWTAGAILNTSMALNIFLYENTQIFTLSR